VFFFAFFMIFMATYALQLTVATFERVLTDLGLGIMSLISVFLAIFLGGSLIPKEIERRTIFMVVSKPISRSTFVVGRYLGNLFTVYFVTFIMTVLLVLQFLADRTALSAPLFTAIAGLFLEVTVISAVSFTFAAATSQFVTIVSTVGLYFIGHLSGDLYRLAARSDSGLFRRAGQALYYVLPNLDRLDFKARATYGDPTPILELGSSALYALGYTMVMLVIACALFERRDFK
jgi:ABC-type transport system involved in multi-copper enzyme maturation permease subunit